MTATNPTPTEQLMDRITAMADEYDITGLQDVVRGQIAINTALETEYSHLRLELAALREFVAAYDNVGQTWESCVSLSDVERLNTANERLDIQRQRLATEYGMALPGGEEEG